jgi:hypothetical protein
MTQPRKLTVEPDVRELLSEEIARLLMRADRVERHEVEALVARVRSLSAVAAQADRASRRWCHEC